MSRYRVVSFSTELPFGCSFTTVPEHPMDIGQLALISVGERFGENLIVGRFYPDVAGYNWIRLPGRLIRVAKDIAIWILGRIVPLDGGFREWLTRPSVFAASLAVLEALTPLVT